MLPAYPHCVRPFPALSTGTKESLFAKVSDEAVTRAGTEWASTTVVWEVHVKPQRSGSSPERNGAVHWTSHSALGTLFFTWKAMEDELSCASLAIWWMFSQKVKWKLDSYLQSQLLGRPRGRITWAQEFKASLCNIARNPSKKRKEERKMNKLVPVAHTYNPSYSGEDIRRITVWSQPGQIVQETLSQPKQGWQGGPVLPKKKKKKDTTTWTLYAFCVLQNVNLLLIYPPSLTT
jgi:hypothetical protein